MLFRSTDPDLRQLRYDEVLARVAEHGDLLGGLDRESPAAVPAPDRLSTYRRKRDLMTALPASSTAAHQATNNRSIHINYKEAINMTKTYRLPKAAVTPSIPKTEISPLRARPRDILVPLPPHFEFSVGPFMIHRSNKQHYRLYSIYAPGNVLVGRQASYPSIYDCLDKTDRKSTRLNSSHIQKSRMPSSA